MKKIIGLLFLLMTSLTCSRNPPQNNHLQHIRGDWVGGWGTFSFEDSSCSYVYPRRDYTRYYIQNDTLIIKERKKYRKSDKERKAYYFLIDRLDKDSLILETLTATTRSLFKTEEERNVAYVPSKAEKKRKNIPIILKRIKQKNSVQLKRLGFYSSGCYGPCPRMYLEIDSLGNFYFEGKGYTEQEGAHSGKLSQRDLEIIRSKIRAIELDSLEASYQAYWTDDQTCGVKLITNDGIFESHAYGINEEPIELTILFHKLMEVYKNVDLQKDSTIYDQFELDAFLARLYPPPPPPPLPPLTKN